MQADPGLFYPKVSIGTRDLQVFPLYGQYKFAGSVDGPLFPTNAIPLLVGAIGADGGRTGQALGNGVTGSTPTGSLTLSGATTPGATTITLSAAGPATNSFVQIDTNTAGVSSTEVRKVASGGGTTTLTLDTALNFSHANGVTVKTVVAPFTHSIIRQNLLDSFTIEKNFGGYQSLQFLGSRVNKYSLKAATTDTEATFVADMMAQNYSILSTPSAVSIVNESPFVFSEYSLNWNSLAINQATNITLDIENGLKSTYTTNQAHTLEFLTALTFRAGGQITVVWDSLNDASFGYFSQAFNGTNAALSLSFAHSTNYGITLNLPEVRLKKTVDDIKIDELVMTTIDYEAEYNFASLTAITASIVNGAWLPY